MDEAALLAQYPRRLDQLCVRLLSRFPGDALLRRALELAHKIHGDHVRKYSGEPELIHPVSVALRLADLGLPVDYAILGLLHDVCERDATLSYDTVASLFGRELANDVAVLTNRWDATRLPRAERKARYAAQLSRATVRAQTVKVADIEDNVPSIVANDPLFAAVYLPEKRAQFQALTAVPFELRAATRKVLADAAAAR